MMLVEFRGCQINIWRILTIDKRESLSASKGPDRILKLWSVLWSVGDLW